MQENTSEHTEGTAASLDSFLPGTQQAARGNEAPQAPLFEPLVLWAFLFKKPLDLWCRRNFLALSISVHFLRMREAALLHSQGWKSSFPQDDRIQNPAKLDVYTYLKMTKESYLSL